MAEPSTTAEATEGPQLINPLDLLDAHGITTSMVAPQHDCRCGASFVIDMSAERPFEHSAGHITDVTIAASHAAAAFLAQVENKGIELPDEFRELLADVAAYSG